MDRISLTHLTLQYKSDPKSIHNPGQDSQVTPSASYVAFAGS